MTIVRVRFNPPTGPVAGRIRFTARHDKDNRPLVSGRDIIGGDTGWIDVPVEGAEIDVRPTEPGWHYAIQGKAEGFPTFSDTKLVPALDSVDFESLVRYDPKAGMAYEPDPEWWEWALNIINLGGVPGKSAYQLAVENGFEGSQSEWVESLEPVTDLATEALPGLMPAEDKAKLDNNVAGRTSTDLVVKIPSDYATLQSAIDDLAAVQVDQGARIFLDIEKHHLLTHGLSLRGGDYSRFWITNEFADVHLSPNFQPVDASAVPDRDWAIFYYENCRAPVLACRIEGGNNYAFEGMIVHQGSHVDVQPNGGVIGTRMNLEVRDATISAKNTHWSKAKESCVRLTDNTRFNITGSYINDGHMAPDVYTDPDIRAALHISRSSMGQAQYMNIARSGFRGITVRRSRVFMDYSNFGSCGLQGGSTDQPVNILSGATLVLDRAEFNGARMSPAQCGVQDFNLTTKHGIVYQQFAPDFMRVNDNAGEDLKSTSISNRLTVSQRLIPAFSLNNPNVTLQVGPALHATGVYVNVANGVTWMTGTGFNARLRAVNALVCGVDVDGRTVRIRMQDSSTAVDETVPLMITVVGVPVV